MTDDLAAMADALDAADSLATFRDHFVGSDDGTIIAYLDGNSLVVRCGQPVSRRSGENGSFVPGTRAGWMIRYASVIRSVA